MTFSLRSSLNVAATAVLAASLYVPAPARAQSAFDGTWSVVIVTESGIHTREDIALMRRHGVNAFLVGEAFMSAPDPGERLRELFFD